MSKLWPSTDLVGGGFGALDAIGGTLLGDGDAAIVITQDQSAYHYTLDATSGAAEDVPNVIIPDTDPGTKRWLLAAPPLLNINYIGFNPNPTGVPVVEGTFWVDRATRMPAYKPDVAASTFNMGLESWTRVRNETGVDIPDGAAVFGAGVIVSPLTGELTFLVVPALAVPGQVAIPGIATSLIPDDGEGFATTRGSVKSYDTSGFTPLAELYLSDTVGGNLEIEPPSPPNYAIPIGYAMDSAVDGKIYVYAQNPTSIVAATDAAYASGDPTGFHDESNIDCSYDPATRKITLTGDLKYSWKGQVKELVSPWVSDAHDAALDVGYYLSSVDGKNFTWSTTPWLFSVVQMAFVWHGTAEKYGLRETHGLMPWQCHQEYHQTTGTYKPSGGDLSAYVLGSTTAADRRPDVAAMTIKDEDITTINALLNSSLYSQAFLTGAGLIDFLVDEPEIVPLVGSTPYYNEFVDPNWQQTPVPNNQRMSVWLVGVPATSDPDSQKLRYMWLQGQTVGTLAGQQALFPEDLALGDFAGLFTEFVFSAKVILRFTGGNWIIEEVQNLTGTRARTTGSPSGNYLTEVTSDDTLNGTGTLVDPSSVAVPLPATGAEGDSIIQGAAINFLTLKNNLVAVVAPAIGDDSGSGYAVKSLWFDIVTSKVYQCLDASIGAAVWVDLTGGGGGGGPLTRISTTVIVPGDSATEFGFTLDKTKTYRLVVEGLEMTVAGASFSFEVSEDGGSTYLTNKMYSNDTRQTSSSSTPVYRAATAAADAMVAWFAGINTKVTFELSWSTHADGWEFMAWYSTYKSNTQSAVGYNGGGIIDVGGDINFINFYSEAASGIENANIYWYEVDYGF